MNAECVTLRNLLVKRGGRVVLEAQELSVRKGEVLAIIGPNGAGKSTLLLTLARLLKPERGEIWFNGQPASAESDLAYRRRIALVLQDPLLFDTSVYENVALGLHFRGAPKSEIRPKVEAWLERLGIPHLSKRRANELSGGEGQRVSLARVANTVTWFSISSWFQPTPTPNRKRPAESASRNSLYWAMVTSYLSR